MNQNAAVRLRIASSIAAVLLFLGLATQWTRHAAPQNDPAPMERTVDRDAYPTLFPDAADTADEDISKVRKATIDWVKNKYPDGKVEGVFTLAFGKGNLYLAGADTQFGESKRRTVDVLVRRYTKRSGGQYFRAEGLEPEQAAQMRQKADFDPDATEDASAEANANGWDDDDECQQ